MSSQQSAVPGEDPGKGGSGAGAGQAGAGPGAGPGDAAGGAGPSEEELRAAYEAELERITTAEVIMQTAVSLLNLGARRLRPPEGGAGAEPAAPGPGASAGRDLEQVRDAIDGVRALMGVLERRYPRELAPLRDALSQLQIAYAREAQSGASQPQAEARPEQGAAGSEEAGAGARAGGGADASGQPSQPGEGASTEEDPGRRPGPAESSGRLWTPGR